ncbi:MAG: glycosyltransferase [Candidatus Omnitrophica bacterium]|nr:glycosyltransferase [Candidatus Omnitrophota bacterium]
MEQRPFFSVIIPSFNRCGFLQKAVGSVMDQTFEDFELIVIDDGSTDGTAGFLKSCADPRLQYFSHANKGVSTARNLGITKSCGTYLSFLDSDDSWTRDKLERTHDYVKKYPGIRIFHTEEIWYKKGKILPQKKIHKKPDGLVYENALKICCIGMSTVTIHKDVFKDVGLFDETFEACEDYDLWLRTSPKYEVKLIPEALTLKDGGRPDQLSNRVWGLDRFRIKALEKMLVSGTLTRDKYELTLLELKKKCSIFALGATKRGNKKAAEHYLSLAASFVKN